MTYFVIRQKSTGLLFPTTGRGSTHAEFTKWGIPRLFPRRSAAKHCLDWWLKGASVAIRTSYNDSGECDEEIHTTPMSDRLPRDYEIVEAEITVPIVSGEA